MVGWQPNALYRNRILATTGALDPFRFGPFGEIISAATLLVLPVEPSGFNTYSKRDGKLMYGTNTAQALLQECAAH